MWLMYYHIKTECVCIVLYFVVSVAGILRYMMAEQDKDFTTEEEATNYKAPAEKSVNEIFSLDTEDESLRKYKETLLGSTASEVCKLILKGIELIIMNSCIGIPSETNIAAHTIFYCTPVCVQHAHILEYN